MPKDPRLHLRGKNGSLRTRLMIMQLIDTMYELSNAPVPSEVIMFKATALPRLIKESNMAKT